MARIFDKVRLGPGQLRAVAEKRFDDAQCLRDSRKNARANGAMYLGGFVIECLLKARLLEKYRWLSSTASPEGMSRHDGNLWSLCYRSHDLDEILASLPEVHGRLSALEQGERQRLTLGLQAICQQWTIFARYSPQSATMKEADEFLERIKEIKEWLR